jgi:pSer/pThr/pTyr-binding forkhead associated (FHA) protein
MKLTFRFYTGEELVKKIPGDSCTIGRSSTCNVVLQQDGVSRKHCLIEIKNNEFYITDLESTNGVLIEGVKIKPNVPILFQTFFTLSFGPVQSLAIEIDEPLYISHAIEKTIVEKTEKPEKPSTNTTGKTNVLDNPPSNEKKSRPPLAKIKIKKTTKEKIKTWTVNLFAFAILAASFWFFKINKKQQKNADIEEEIELAE